ncbi:MAG: leucyl aminopeptidase family protein [Alphaproteobacteria bacterium]|nr:leucyl aminopeptidase family protein [Alphaproteobacteria bacterium]
MLDLDALFAPAGTDAVPLHMVGSDDPALLEGLLGADGAAWAKNSGFTGKSGSIALIPGVDGSLIRVIVGLGEAKPDSLWALAGVADKLPEGTYALADGTASEATLLGWALSGYRFDRYKSMPVQKARLVWPAQIDSALVMAQARGVALARDLVNTPAEDMGPSGLAEAARTLAEAHGAAFSVVVGEDLLAENFPMIHAVGRAAADAPRLIDLVWGREDAPKVTLVGKGVCFDSGGLDLKPASGMKLMKKDMGGSAQVLAIASMVMETKLDVRLRVLIPAVENAVSGNAFRPMDILKSRKGLTVEVGNTDAEGRLVLADALTLADAETPDMIIDFATLTGAARVALGTDLPALFATDDQFAGDVLEAGLAEGDPLWRMPLHDAYDKQMDGKIADLSSTGESPFGGAITAALFLRRFVTETKVWAHVDVMSWNTATRPGRPEGGEAQGPRAVFEMLRRRYR